MKIYKNIISGIAIVAGALFIFNIQSDIQFGFGLVLIMQGLLGFRSY